MLFKSSRNRSHALSRPAQGNQSMASYQTILTSQPQHDAPAALLVKDQDTVLWNECRLIWDSASLVLPDAKESEVMPTDIHTEAAR